MRNTHIGEDDIGILLEGMIGRTGGLAVVLLLGVSVASGRSVAGLRAVRDGRRRRVGQRRARRRRRRFVLCRIDALLRLALQSLPFLLLAVVDHRGHADNDQEQRCRRSHQHSQ